MKARYSKHYQISEEALSFLIERTQVLHGLVKAVCKSHLITLDGEIAEEKSGR